MVTFSELCPLTVYSCSIFAFTVAAGPISPAINVSTAKSGIASIYHTVSYSATKWCSKFKDYTIQRCTAKTDNEIYWLL